MVKVEKVSPKLGIPPERRKAMPASKAQQKAVSKYMKENYDVYQIRMKKGQKDDIKAVAAAAGESMNQYIINAIDQRTISEAAGGPQEAGVVSLPPDTLKAAQEAAEAAGEGLPVFVARAVETQAQRDDLSRRMKGGKTNE